MCSINIQYLKIVFLIPMLVSSHDLNDEQTNTEKYVNTGVDSTFHDFLQYKLSNILKKGNETLGLPVFDPFLQNKITVHIDYDSVVGDIELNYLKVQGISNYIVKNASLSVVSRKLIFGLDFSEIHAESFYKLDGFINNDIHLFGNGSIKVTFKKFSVDAIVGISIDDELSIKSMDIKIILDAITVNVSGLFHDEFVSETISALIEEIAPRLIVEYQTEITTIIVERVIEIGNIFLKGTTIVDFMGVGWQIFLRKFPFLDLKVFKFTKILFY